MRTSGCANCGTRTATSSARKEGKDWFCSQSCLLQYESKAARSQSFLEARPPKGRGGHVGPVRVVGKVIKWGVILVVLATTAFVIAIVVAVAHGLNDVNKTITHAEASSRRAAALYPKIKHGTTPAALRRGLGKPEDVSADGYVSGGVCWYYGNALSNTGKVFEFCFKRGKLYSKSRL
jgi:hypothetical protein